MVLGDGNASCGVEFLTFFQNFWRYILCFWTFDFDFCKVSGFSCAQIAFCSDQII